MYSFTQYTYLSLTLWVLNVGPYQSYLYISHRECVRCSNALTHTTITTNKRFKNTIYWKMIITFFTTPATELMTGRSKDRWILKNFMKQDILYNLVWSRFHCWDISSVFRTTAIDKRHLYKFLYFFFFKLKLYISPVANNSDFCFLFDLQPS